MFSEQFGGSMARNAKFWSNHEINYCNFWSKKKWILATFKNRPSYLVYHYGDDKLSSHSYFQPSLTWRSAGEVDPEEAPDEADRDSHRWWGTDTGTPTSTSASPGRVESGFWWVFFFISFLSNVYAEFYKLLSWVILISVSFWHWDSVQMSYWLDIMQI